MQLLRQFILALCTNWIALMSGFVGVVFTVCSFYVRDPKNLFVALAIIAAMVASFRLWMTEHRAAFGEVNSIKRKAGLLAQELEEFARKHPPKPHVKSRNDFPDNAAYLRDAVLTGHAQSAKVQRWLRCQICCPD